MEANCQRCHETLRETDRFCPACGLPQLIYVAAETQLAATDASGDVAGPDFSPGHFGMSSGIAWRPALRSAAMLAIPTGILCLANLPLGLVVAGGAAGWAVLLYSRRARTVRLPASAGARIGLVMGVIAGWLTASLYGIQLWVARFLLHQGGEWDSQWQTQVEKTFRNNQQMVAQMGAANAQSAQIAESMRTMMLSSEGRGGLLLMELVFLGLVLVFFATIGGAIGARLLVQPRRPEA